MSIIKFPDVTSPSQYEEICKQVVVSFINKMQWDIQNKLGIHDNEAFIKLCEEWNQTPLAELVSQVAKVAAGDLPSNETIRDETYEAIQDLMETLFSSRADFAFYDIPNSFWDTPFGEMVSLAFLYIQNDELITQAEAAKIAGITIQAVHQAIKDGRLKSYKDPNSPGERQGRTLVSKAAILELWQS